MDRLSILFISLLVLTDYMSKLFIKSIILEANQFIEKSVVVNDYIILSIYYNKGIAFSFLDSDSLAINYFVIFLVAVIILYLLSIFIKNNKNFNKLEYSSYILILGGALGNFIDRLFNQSVLDFIIIHYDDIYFPGIFNFADMFITIGVLLIIISYLTGRKKYD
ncbi:MAG: signal peptidase II [Gammaproteobacteria bacterium]|nr:signal peptidase II [Gammaproteobacteria bacterium]MBT5644097.1 signal peptidase II [Gammaproteobacteria bacterium]MDG2159665.1 signal peptidase II [Gammaproteobacteria bacterium]